MLEQRELESNSASDSMVDEDEVLVPDASKLVKEDLEEEPITKKNESSNEESSFKPLSFANEENGTFHSGASFELTNEKTDSEKISISEGFKNSEFFYENSLLTNAEDFANSIREGANLHKAKLLTKIEQKANDTDRIREQMLSENQEAKQKREDLLSSAKEKVEEIKKEAFQEGYDDGYKTGMQVRYDEAEPLVTQVNYLLGQINSLREVVRFQAEKELVKLALKIAKNIVVEEIRLNDSVVENIVKVALRETEMEGKIYLYLNPQDYEFLINSKCDLEKYLNGEQKILVRQRSELEPGSIFVESDGEVISRSIESQFKKIENALDEQINKNEAQLTDSYVNSDDNSLNTIIESENYSNIKSFSEETQSKESEKDDMGENSISEKEDIHQEGKINDLDKNGIDLGKIQMDQEGKIGEDSKKDEEEILENSFQSEFVEDKDQIHETESMASDKTSNFDEIKEV